MGILFLIIGVLVGAIAVYFIMRSRQEKVKQINQAQLEALTKYAKKYNINIIGSGDTTQNGAVIKGTKSGLTEDFIS